MYYMTIVYEYIENIHKITSKQVLKQIEFIMIMKYQYFVQVFLCGIFHIAELRNCGKLQVTLLYCPPLPFLNRKGPGKRTNNSLRGQGQGLSKGGSCYKDFKDFNKKNVKRQIHNITSQYVKSVIHFTHSYYIKTCCAFCPYFCYRPCESFLCL